MIRELKGAASSLIPWRRAPHSHWQTIKSDRATLDLAVGTVTIAGLVLAAQYSRLLSRRTHSPGTEGLIDSAPAAAVDTVGVAVEGKNGLLKKVRHVGCSKWVGTRWMEIRPRHPRAAAWAANRGRARSCARHAGRGTGAMCR